MSADKGKKFNVLKFSLLCLGENKKSAFTLAELMVIMAVLTVVLAALAPVFTSRYSNISLDTVWGNVGASNMNDIYSDAPIRSMMQQILIGITPIDLEDIRKTYQPYSKVIIRSSNKIGGNKLQKQIEFRQNGSNVGYLFAGNANLLLGGKYPNLSFTYVQPDVNDITAMQIGEGASGNTAIGTDALNALTTGKNNTAFGFQALKSITTGLANTALGVQTGSNLTTAEGNTLIGFHAYDASSGNYNTIIGNNTASKSNTSNYTTAVGNNIAVKGNHNVAIGDSSGAVGEYNTAIGYGALQLSSTSSDSYSNFKYNTGIGYNACKGIGQNAKKTTCIGGSGVDVSKMSSTAQSFFTDSNERVLIGRPATAYSSAATLEVHNLTTNGSKYPYPNSISGMPNLGDSSVVVNGNLIVRGQTYMIGRSPFPMAPGAGVNTYANTISLMGYRLYKESTLAHKPLIGVDGSELTQRIKNADSYMREAYTGREHCICNYSCSASKDYAGGSGYSGRDSYDWSYLAFKDYTNIIDNSFGGYNYFWGHYPHKCGASYNDNSYTAANIELDQGHNLTDGGSNSVVTQLISGGSCCPILTPAGIRRTDSLGSGETSSDIRLKNIKSPFEKGLESLSKLHVYNYFFKNDKSKIPHTGVIAQDLKRIFPNAVSKDKKGYYQIRRDEMFYGAINSVKSLYVKVQNLISRLQNDAKRIIILKRENKELKEKLIKLAKELDELEK